MNSRYNNRKYMGLDATNEVLLRFKPACSATVTSWKIKNSLEANYDAFQKANNKGTDRPGPVSAFAVRTLGPEDKFSCIEDLMLTPLHGMFLV